MTITPLALALGKIPSGLFILTIRHGSDRTGMLASWVMQAGFEPPMISVAVRKDRYLAEWMTPGAAFVLNCLPEGDKVLLKHFARGFEPGADAFDGVAVKHEWQSIPVLTEAAGHLECMVVNHLDSGDHRVFLAEVAGGDAREDAQPWTHVRKTGLRY
jgi:flavin reductase (DIM6/NTAB) family NADH-FMN oxidoreductase RutF